MVENDMHRSQRAYQQLEFTFNGSSVVGEVYDRLAVPMSQWSWYNDHRVIQAVVSSVTEAGGLGIELCCGSGILLRALAGVFHSKRWIGVDISDRMLTLADETVADCPNASVIAGDWTRPVQDIVANANMIVIKNALHLLPNVAERLRTLRSLAASDAQLVIVETVSPSEAANKWVRRLFGAIDHLGIKHEIFTRESLRSTLRESGWGAIDTRYIKQEIAVPDWLARKTSSNVALQRAREVFRDAPPEVRRSMGFCPHGADVPREMLRLQAVLNCQPLHG